MDGNRKTHKGSHTSREDGGPPDHQENQEQASSDIISMEHLRRLVRLLDQSDVSELELKRPEDGTRLVLRKVKAAKVNRQPDGSMPMLQADTPATASSSLSATTPRETKHTIVAHLVGIFHTWGNRKGSVLVTIGDQVKAGQLVATVESLNVINEVETPIAGRVIEILVQEGQPVEYGQPLMVIDSGGEEERD